MTVTRSEQIGDLAAALAKARAAFKPIGKDKTARITPRDKPSFSYTYADLAMVVDATREALAANGIAVMQPTSLEGGHVVVTTIMAHASGQWVEEKMTWPVVATDNRSIGSGITYARRHSLLAMVGAAASDEDDDAQAARGGDQATAAVLSISRAAQTAPDHGKADLATRILSCSTLDELGLLRAEVVKLDRGSAERARIAAVYTGRRDELLLPAMDHKAQEEGS